jgi:lipopolysaccharide/colanic/teichoic acid biosynthesis glycosyltransferase
MKMATRVFDLVVAFAGLIVLSPLFAVVALLIKLDSPGSVFFRGKRVGKDGQPFHILKFRTMVQNAAQIGPGVTSSGDPRITRIGNWLRRTKVDELPQLWNVVRGEMSLIGPRPEDPRYVALYTDEQRRILSVRPGITSPASIQFRHEEALLPPGDMDTYIKHLMPAKLQVDLIYLERQTFWSDLAVLFRTFIRLVQ